MTFELSEREQLVLAQVISGYLSNVGAAVASSTVSQQLRARDYKLSSASVRSIMSDLEDAGLLCQPHSSAGRVPTPQGIRFYIDCLIETTPLSMQEQGVIEKLHSENRELQAVVHETSRILSRLSSYVGLIAAPEQREMVIEHMEFVRLAPNRLLGIFVAREGLTQNRILELVEPVSVQQIERINNLCREIFAGNTLAQARALVQEELAQSHSQLDDLRAQAIAYTAKALPEDASANLIIDGISSLLDHPEFFIASKAKALMQALEEQRQLANFLEQASKSVGVQVFIGAESGYDALQDCSIVLSPYHRNGKVLGTLGVIGPTRMAYGRVIPIVQCAAEQISQWLEKE